MIFLPQAKNSPGKFTLATQIVPPSILFFSIKIVFAPERADEIAAKTPAVPPPITKTSQVVNEYSYHIPAKSFVKETLIRLKNGGNSLNVLTASPHTMLDVCLKRLDMYDLFDNVWSCDDFGLTKDNCEIYLNAARRLNTSVEKCCFIDDNINAVSAAKKAGMTAIGIYDRSSDTLVDRMKKISDRYIYDFREL